MELLKSHTLGRANEAFEARGLGLENRSRISGFWQKMKYWEHKMFLQVLTAGDVKLTGSEDREEATGLHHQREASSVPQEPALKMTWVNENHH